MKDQMKFRLLALAAVSLIGMATVVFKLLEGWSWVDSLYFSVVAVTTVGFGDLAPTSDGSKIFAVLYLVSGVTIIGSWLNARANRHQRLFQQHRDDSD
ncbi:MAG: potassium channel family protein [Acidimicrobiia bacterium]